MAKKKKNRKKKPVRQSQKISPKNYIRKHARKVPIYECLIRDDWRGEQFSPVIVTRQKQNGDLILGAYIVDMQCLGLKDTSYVPAMDEFDYKGYIANMEQGMYLQFMRIDPMLCFNIIYGSIEFAEDCGFQPHKDFEITEYILDDAASIEYMEVPLGKDGKPFFVAGPYDNSEKILATLQRTKGEGNFDFIAEIMPDDFVITENENDKLAILAEFFPEEFIEKKLDSLSTEEE